MSQSSSSKGKDASGKKFASLNVNQTFKGTKVENRSAAGQPRHGMQLLGKVSHQSRRVPAPAYLPSLKKENLGNDPTVSLVPSGSSGWVKKEKILSKTEDQAESGQKKAPKAEQATEISLRPNAGAGFKSQSDQGKGWGNLQAGAGATQPSSSNLFQREFPKLGVDGEGQSTEESAKGKDSEEREPAGSSSSNVPPRFTGEKWTGGQSPIQGPGQRPGAPSMNMSIEQQRAMFNGAHMQPPGASQFYPYGHMAYMMIPPFPYPYPPNRMPPPRVMGQPPRPAPPVSSSEASERPATVKSEDIQDMGDNSDDEGWAGAQEEVDYNVKLKFDESDEEPEPAQTASSSLKSAKDENNLLPSKESTGEKSKESGPVEAWGEHPVGYQGQMPFRHPHQWMRGPFPPYDSTRGPPPQGFPYPAPWMYPSMQGYSMPAVPPQRPESGSAQGQQAASGTPPSTSQSSAAANSPTPDSKEQDSTKFVERRKRKEEDEKNETARREAARLKLKELEEKIKKRGEQQRDGESSNRPSQRERLDSENSDSSRGASQRSKSSRDMPPRFLKQQTQSKGSRKDDTAPVSPSPFDGGESGSSRDTIPVPRIMKRHGSLRSDDASSIHSNDSWANGSLDEQEKNRETEDAFAVGTKRNGKVVEVEAASKTEDEHEERHDKKRDLESESRKKRQDSKSNIGKTRKESDDGQKYSRAPATSGSQKGDQNRDARRSSRGSDRRDGTREYKTSRDHREEKQGRGDRFSEVQEQARDERQNKHKNVSREREVDGSNVAEDGKQSREAKLEGANKGSGGKESTQRAQRADSQKTADKEERVSAQEKVGGFVRPKTIADNFKRLEKPKAKSLSLKTSKVDEKERHTDKAVQKSLSETKKPAAWSQVVSGETAEQPSGTVGALGKVEMQPKKSLIEIQKEEEIENEKENLKQSGMVDRHSIETERDGHDFQRRDARATKDRRQDDQRFEERRYDGRYNRRGYDTYDDRYYDKREYQGRRKPDRETRKADDKVERKRGDGDEDEATVESRFETFAPNKGHDGKKRVVEDRKRRHEETEISIDPYEKIYSEEVQAEGRLREQKVEKQKSFERRYDRPRYTERGRGMNRDRQQSTRGRGRGVMTGKSAFDSKDGYPFSEVKPDIGGTFSDKPHSFEGKDAVKSDLEGEAFQDDKDNEAAEANDRKKEKENRDPERRGYGAPSKRSDGPQYESRRQRDRQESFEFNERTSHSRQERYESRRGRSSSGVAKYSTRKESGSSYKRDRRVEKGFTSNRPDEGELPGRSEKVTEQGSGDKEGRTDHEAEYDDDEYEDDGELTDEYGDDSETENGERASGKERASSTRTKEYRERRHSDRGSSRVGGGHKPARQREHRGYESGLSKSQIGPRFLKYRSDGSDRARGKSFGVRGSRGRGRLRGSRGRGNGKTSFARDTRPKSSDVKDEEYSGESDDEYHSAEGSLGSVSEDTRRADIKHASDASKRHVTRGKWSFRGSSSRGRGARRGGSTDHFLADRQQDRVGHIDASGLAGTLPAAGKAPLADQKAAEEKYGLRPTSSKRGSSTKRQTGDQRVHSYVEVQQEFAEPPKKMAKSKSIEKTDFLRQFDVNNIASVVCIDDMPQNTENADTVLQSEEDDGFVEVCSRKKQKVLREIQKEEEKKKLQEELSIKSTKRNMGDAKESSNKAKHFKIVDQHAQRTQQSFSPVSSQTPITSSASQSQTSNAAMAAVGGWEPAQALLRGVQIVSQAENLDGTKSSSGAAQSPLNAWKRPLSFAASLSSSSVTASSGTLASAPDPKAVGTGKPNTSPAKQLPLANQVNQPNEGVIVNGAQIPYNDGINENDQVKSQDIGGENGNMDTIDKLEGSSDSENKDPKNPVTRKTEQRKINKGTKRETAPRFQSMAKGKVPQSPVRMYSEGMVDKKRVSTTMEDVPKSVLSKLKVEDRAPGKRPGGSKLRRCNSESSKEQPENGLKDFDGEEHPTLTFMHPESRSKAEETQPNLKEEVHRRGDVLDSLDGSAGKVDVKERTSDEENAKDTARSVIKSLGDDDEKNLETRSLPSSTPPLAVEVHPPGPSKGPSSDPGITKGPGMPVQNSMSQEVNEMSKKVLSLKSLWETPSLPEVITESSTSHATWKSKDSTVVTSTVVTTTATTESEQRDSGIVKDQVASTPVAIVTAQGMGSKNEAELESSSDPGMISKKTTSEQQNNVCKVKPQQKQQQQQLTEDKQMLPSFSHSQLFPSQFPLQQPYALSMPPSSSQPYIIPLERGDGGSIYPHERSVGDVTNHHTQPHTAVGLQQVRSASPLSHQQDVLQQNVLHSSIYNTSTLQGSQQNTLLWPVVSRHGIQPATSLSYMSHPQSHHDPAQDLLSSSATLSSTPLYMTYDQTSSSVFSAQRINSQLPQNPQVGLVLQQPHLRSASLLNVMQANQNNKDNSIFSMSPSPNPFQQTSDLQLMGMTQSDLMKHVHAKPFQPSSRTPPGGQTPQIFNQHHHSQFLGHQHLKFPNQMGKLGNQQVVLHQQQGTENHSSALHLPDKRQLMQSHSSQLMQSHSSQQHAVQHLLPSHQQTVSQQSSTYIRPLALQQSSMQQTSPFLHQHAFPGGGRIASVGPRSVQGKSVTSTTSVQPQARHESLSPVDQNMHFIQGGLSSLKALSQQQHHPMPNSTGNSLVQILPHAQKLPAGQAQNHSFTVRPSSQMQKFIRTVPGPIQRPVKSTSQQNVVSSVPNRPKQPVHPMVKTTEGNSASKSSLTSGLGNSFRNEEHQKMIEETKKYFAAQQLKNEATSLTGPAVSAPSSRVDLVSTGSLSTVQVSIAKTAESKAGKSGETKVTQIPDNRQLKPTDVKGDPKNVKSSEVKDVKSVDSRPDVGKSNTEKKELPDVAASAMLNDPSDIISIIKNRPSLAKAFKLEGVSKDKNLDKTREKKSKLKDEKSKKGDALSKKGSSTRGGHRWSSTKEGQKVGVSKPQSSRKSGGLSSEKPKNASSNGKGKS